MSYILDALRKSEQQRQAIQPDTVTDRILVNPPPPKQKSSKWVAALVIGNLLVIAYLFWHFTQKTATESTQKVAVNPDKPLLSATSTKPTLPQAVTTQNKIAQPPNPSLTKKTVPQSPSPSIAQLIEEKKMTAIQPPIKQLPEKKPIAIKKELPKRIATTPTIRPEPSDTMPEKPATLPPKKGILALDDLPYDVRNSLPNLNINVFSYANQPEERFVIIDMVKYRTGQLIKGSVKLKEILPNSIVLQYDSNTFRVERP